MYISKFIYHVQTDETSRGILLYSKTLGHGKICMY